MPRLVLLSLQHKTRFRGELRRMSTYYVSVPPVGVKSHCPLVFLGAIFRPLSWWDCHLLAARGLRAMETDCGRFL